MKIQSIIIIILVIVSSWLGVSYYNANQEIKFLSDSKNLYYKWSPNDESLGLYWKNNDKLSSLNIDRNYDLNFEIINLYNTVGQLIQTGYDSNEDGVYEKGKYFDIYGKIVGDYTDADEDGVIDKFSLILDSGNKISFIDTDVDGRYEKVIIKDSLKTSEIAIEEFFKNK